MSRKWPFTRHDRRVLLLTALAGLPGVIAALWLLRLSNLDPAVRWPLSVLLVVGWLGLSVAA